MADCPDFYSISPSQVDAVGESLWGSYYTNPSLEMADTEIEEYMNKTFPKLDDPPTSDPHQPLPCTSNATDEADGKSSATDNPPSSNYQPPPRASAAVNQKESEKDPGDFLEDEEKFWETGALGTETPEKLLHTVFYLNGKNFLLRGGEEHYNLKISQMQRFENPPRYEYTELVSKNRAGGLASYRLKNKVVPVFQDESLGKQCHVYVLDLYLSKIPSSARAQDVFYLRPKPVNMEDDNPWYSSQRIGRNRISQLMKTICSVSGVQNKYTNHSLRATGATRLFQSGTPENVIMERSGHRSTDGVRQYERVSQDQHIAAQAILTARDGFRAYDAELQSVQKRKKAIKESPTKSARKPLTENMSQHPLSQTQNATVLPDTQKESKLLSLIPVMDDGKKLVHLHFSNCTFHF